MSLSSVSRPPARGAATLRIAELLGQGAQATVYAALQDTPTRAVPVAVKVARDGGAAAALLRSEGRVLARLTHPRVMGLRSVVTVANRPALVLDRVEGEDALSVLRSAARRAEVSPAAALRIAADAAAALAYVASQGVAHRDLKPSNLLVGLDGRTVLADFGVARSMSPAATAGACFAGTRRYMAPEVDAGGLGSPAADVFSLGITLLELLLLRRVGVSGRRAAPSPALVRQSIAALPYAQAPGLLAAVGSQVASMLAERPEDRPSAAEVALDLAALADRAPGVGPRVWVAHASRRGSSDRLALVGAVVELESPTRCQETTWLTEATAPPVGDLVPVDWSSWATEVQALPESLAAR